MKSPYFQHAACILAFLATGLYDVMDNFKGLMSGIALFLLLSGAIVGSFLHGRRIAIWKLFLTGLCGFVLSTIVGSMFNSSVNRAAAHMVASIYDYKQHTGAFPESLMQVANAGNIRDLSRKRIKYGSRVHYMRTEEGFALSYDNYAFNGQSWNMEKKAFVEMVD